MGCGASKNDVIKSASASENQPKAKETGNSDKSKNGNKKEKEKADLNLDENKSSEERSSSRNSSIDSEGSTIPASEKFGNGSATSTIGNNNDIRGGFENNINTTSNGTNIKSGRNLPELPPLKPPRTSKVGFLDQTSEMASTNKDDSDKSMPVAFEVPAEDGDSSLIKKHPPRRLRQLETSPENAPITQELLEEKVALANERRNQVLHQRVASARQKSARAGGRVRKIVVDPELEENELGETSDLPTNPPTE